MNHKNIFVLLVALAIFSPQVKAWTLGASAFEFEPINSNVFVMHGPLTRPSKENHGFMNNPGFIESNNGIILIDPGSTLEVGNAILNEIQKYTNKPVLAIFNTHIHGDHWLANQSVKKAFPAIKIYGHQRMIELANDSEGLNWLDLMYRLTEGLSTGTEIHPPTISVTHNQTITIDGEHFLVHSFSPTHTDSDIMIEHIESQTLFLGDNCVINRMSRFDSSASILGNIKALEYAALLEIKVFVPGHGPSGAKEKSLIPYLEYLQKLKRLVAEGLDNDLEDYEIKQAVFNQFKDMGHWVGFDASFGVNLNKMYLELEDLML